jgi:putative ABC transport system permease protein
MSERAMTLSFMGMMSAILTALDYVSIIILLIMTMILGNTIAMGVRERTHEYGVLRALGFTPRHVAMFVLGEALTVGLLAGIVGLALAYPIVELGMGRWLEENMGAFFPYFRIDTKTMVAAVLLSVALGVVSSVIPAYRASKLNVTDALRRVA